MRGAAWVVLFGIAIVQLMAALVDESYVPLKEGQYRIQYDDRADETRVEGLKDVKVFVRHDLWTPIPLLETSSVGLLALLVLGATSKGGRSSDAACERGG